MNLTWLRSPQSARKVPEITGHFWAIKLLTTAMGESLSDFLVITIDPYVAVSIATVALLVAFVLQFRVKRYVPAVYWLTVSMVAVFGTMAADVLHVGLGVPYWISACFFAAALAVVFVTWRRVEGTLSIHSIKTPRREVFYWLPVLATFALGTAAGDASATTLHLGYFGSILLFLVFIAIPIVLYWRRTISAVFAFWFAYVITRPLGASIADWLGVSKHVGGVGIGHGPVSLVLIAAIVVYVRFITIHDRRTHRID